MKKYIKEMIILLIQIIMFYIFPLLAGPKDPIGMVLFLLLTTFILGIIIASITKERIKYIYPLVVVLIFIPTVYIYYNESALIHSFWYFITSSIGVLLGTIINKIVK